MRESEKPNNVACWFNYKSSSYHLIADEFNAVFRSKAVVFIKYTGQVENQFMNFAQFLTNI